MGKIFCFGSDVDTDQIIASQYLLYPSVEEMAPHCFESLDENFASAVREGDFVVARDNFGCGSSREQAPAVLKALGVRAVFANSFARIFFRNAINIGLPLVEIGDQVDHIKPDHAIGVELEKGLVHNLTTGETYQGTALPPFIQEIAKAGGLVEFAKHRK